MKKFSLMLIALFATTFVFAGSYNNTNDSCPSDNNYQDNCPPNPCPPEPCCEPCPSTPCCDVPQSPTMPAYNAPASINVCGAWDFYVTGTFLWWEPKQENMEIALTTNQGQPNNPGEFFGLDYKFKAAFKVSLGYNFNHDDWGTNLQYTRFNSTINGSAEIGNATNMWNLWIVDADAFTDVQSVLNVDAKWKVDHNIFDFQLIRPAYNGKNLTLKPHAGLKGGWIDQKLTNTSLDNLGAETYYSTFESKSWLIGPRVGIDGNWFLVDRFRIFADAAFSLFYQKFSKILARTTSSDPTDTTIGYGVEHNLSQINSSTEIQLGLAWGKYFDRNNWYFDISAGYDVQIYFDQNIISDARSTDITKPGNLMFHGLNATIRFDF
ncbi:MAG: hypothetical protein JXA94_06000 [Parachlamydiales bacterium]|nr:hypothetical protein [Parachlamydiales bacterium]